MILPIGDAPNARQVPWVTYLLIAANVAAYLLLTLPLGTVRPDPADPRLAEYLRAMSRALGHRVPAAAYQHFLDALDLERAGPVADAARRGLATVERLQKRQIRPRRIEAGR